MSVLPFSKPVFRVHTLCQRKLIFPYSEGVTVGELKEEISRGKDIRPDEVMLLAGGTECSDMDQAPAVSSAVVRSGTSRSVELQLKRACSDKAKSDIITLSFPINTRIRAVKSYLLKQKYTKWSVTGQRLISSSIVMKDYQILGDFLLHQKKHTKSNDFLPLVLFLSQTVDSCAEMEFHVTLCNKQEIKFNLEFGIPLYYAKEILQNQFGIMKNIDYHFIPKGGGQNLFDMNKSLLDYGFLPTNGRKIHVYLILRSDMPPLSAVPFFDLEMLNGKSDNIANSATNKRKRIQRSKVTVSTTPRENAVDDPQSRSSSPILFSSATLKKKPSGRKSPACGMFGGMKKGFLSSSKHKKNIKK